MAGDVVALDAGDATPWTVARAETLAGVQRALCTPQLGSGTAAATFPLVALTLVSSATRAPFFATAAAGGNTGTGAIDAGAILDGRLWVPDTYAVIFALYDFEADPARYQGSLRHRVRAGL